MITFSLNISNPWSDRWSNIYCTGGKTIFANKSWELQIDKTSDILGFDMRYTRRQDHAGLFLSASLLGFELIINLFDVRHWDYEKNDWEVYEYVDEHQSPDNALL